jgi:hypothetical protein
MKSCRDTLSMLRGEGWSGREPQFGSIMFRHRDAIGEVIPSEAEMFLEKRRQLAASV